MNTTETIVREPIMRKIKLAKKVNDKAFEDNAVQVEKMFYTIGKLCYSGKYPVAINAQDGNSYQLKDYKLENRLSGVVTPRSVQSVVGDTSPELVVRPDDVLILDSSMTDELILDSNVHDKYVSYVSEDGLKTEEVAASVRFGAENGCIVVHDDKDSVLSVNGQKKATMDILTPGEFLEAQSILFSWFKNSLGPTSNMEELTSPCLLNDVVDAVDDGKFTTSIAKDSSKLPVTLRVAYMLYKPWMFNYPVSDYANEFAAYLVSTRLNSRPGTSVASETK